MLPVIAIVGRPNVGKSTLFNCLTGTRDALVADVPGLTRDRLYGIGNRNGRRFLAIDTGGLSDDSDAISRLINSQVMLAIEEADAVLFMLDGRSGITPLDREIADRLRRSISRRNAKPGTDDSRALVLVVNKTEGLDTAVATGEFHEFGLGEPCPIAAAHKHGIHSLIDTVLARVPEPPAGPAEASDSGVRVAIIGRPNVGKSTLVNRLLGAERVLAHDSPGTTRDSIRVPFDYRGREYVLIDTAGIRRRARVSDRIEKFSVIKSLQAIDAANVVVLITDAREGVSDQDVHLLGLAIESGRAVVIGINKWDVASPDQRRQIRLDVERRFTFADFARTRCISALVGTGLGELMASVNRAWQSAALKLPASKLTEILAGAVERNPPPLVRGRRIKLRYAHQGGQNPPVIVIHGNQTSAVPDNYRRYLSRTFRDALRMEGTPVRVEFKTGGNPFQGRRNVLTPRQKRRRLRVIRHAR